MLKRETGEEKPQKAPEEIVEKSNTETKDMQTFADKAIAEIRERTRRGIEEIKRKTYDRLRRQLEEFRKKYPEMSEEEFQKRDQELRKKLEMDE